MTVIVQLLPIIDEITDDGNEYYCMFRIYEDETRQKYETFLVRDYPGRGLLETIQRLSGREQVTEMQVMRLVQECVRSGMVTTHHKKLLNEMVKQYLTDTELTNENNR